jgi:hypothetical protein
LLDHEDPARIEARCCHVHRRLETRGHSTVSRSVPVTVGTPAHTAGFTLSSWQAASQPSPGVVFESSHSSPPSIAPFPHAAGTDVEVVVVVAVVVVVLAGSHGPGSGSQAATGQSLPRNLLASSFTFPVHRMQ